MNILPIFRMKNGEKKAETRFDFWVLLILQFFYKFVIIDVVNTWLAENSPGHVLYCLRLSGHQRQCCRDADKCKRGKTSANPEFAVECFLFHAVRWATPWYEISRMFWKHLRFQFWREEAPERGRNAGKRCCGSIWQSWSV